MPQLMAHPDDSAITYRLFIFPLAGKRGLWLPGLWLPGCLFLLCYSVLSSTMTRTLFCFYYFHQNGRSIDLYIF